jgi:hypothetical protein
MTLHSLHAQRVLDHLKKLKPTDGWTITQSSVKNSTYLTLKRRNVPLSTTENKDGYEEIVLDNRSGCVVGVTSYMDSGKRYARGVVLVEKDGVVAKASTNPRELRVTMSDKSDLKDFQKERMDNRERAAASSDQRRSSTSSTPRYDTQKNNEDLFKLVQIGFALVVAFVILRIITKTLFLFYILGIPALALYAMHSCPRPETFEPKKEIKRVLRGDSLPKNHPDKPAEDWLSQTFAKVKASVTTELATSLGYQMSFQVSP